MLIPAETVYLNLSTYEVEIFTPKHKVKRKSQVSRSTVWRLLKMWVLADKDWRNLQWDGYGECILFFRHRRKIEPLGVMTWKEYHEYQPG